MKHYLNVCDVDGGEIAPVDIVTFGSPCQDLSVAGKRAGLDGARSGLFMEAVRIIKEMRGKTDGKSPTFAIWENVPGAFSSQKGEDFRVVLEELAKIKASGATIPRPPKGKWTDAGAIMGDGWSLAWRVLDAQFHGVPQRRRRILLVADFAGGRAGEILFECSGLPGYSAESGASGQEIAPDASVCAGTDDSTREKCLMPDAEGLDGYNLTLTGDIAATLGVNCGTSTGRNGVCRQMSGDAFLEERGICIPINDKATRYRGGGESRNGDGCGNGLGIGKPGDPSPTLTVGDHHAVCCAAFSAGQGAKAGGIGWQEECAPTLKGVMSGGNTVQTICLYGNGIDRADTAKCNGRGWTEDVCYTLNTIDRPAVCLLDDQGGSVISATEDATVAPTIRAQMHGNIPAVCVGFDGYSQETTGDVAQTLRAGKADGDHVGIVVYDARGNGDGAIVPTITGDHEGHISDYTAVAVEYLRNVVRYIVRRLTPTECARLQGLPDWWSELPTITDMSDEDYAFWCDVLKTKAEIEDKPYKQKTRPQMVAWYNKLHNDGAEYKMWGNGIALPVVRVPLHEMAKLGAKTLGSLFDGSGGFPLAGAMDGITPLWASEIEPYPIAVTRARLREVTP